MTDTAGATSTTQVTVTIQGANDAPVGIGDSVNAIEAGGYGNATAGSSGSGNVLTNDTDVDAGDTKSVSGVVAGAQSSATGNVGSSVSGTYGAITLQADGNFTFNVDNSHAAVQALRTVSDTLTEYFTYQVSDAAGLNSLATITITITGQNDAPTASNDGTTAREASGIGNATAGSNGTGNVLTNDSDLDAGDTKTVTGVTAGPAAGGSGPLGASVTGTYGSITINSDGSYTYIVDESNAAVQALRLSSQTLSELFTYTMRDTAGLTSSATVTITIEGANDAPTAVADNVAAIEAGGVANGTSGANGTGNVLSNDTDPDSFANARPKRWWGWSRDPRLAPLAQWEQA